MKKMITILRTNRISVIFGEFGVYMSLILGENQDAKYDLASRDAPRCRDSAPTPPNPGIGNYFQPPNIAIYANYFIHLDGKNN